MIAYKIKSLFSMGHNCPPPIIKSIFPSFTGEHVTLSSDGMECVVVFESEQTPVDVGPLISVEVIDQESTQS